MLVSENQRPTELTSLTAAGTGRDVIKYSFPQRYAESYVGTMEHFFDVVQGTGFTVEILRRHLFKPVWPVVCVENTSVRVEVNI